MCSSDLGVSARPGFGVQHICRRVVPRQIQSGPAWSLGRTQDPLNLLLGGGLRFVLLGLLVLFVVLLRMITLAHAYTPVA